MSREPKITISLHGEEGLELDPWTGFRGQIRLAVSSANETTIGAPPLLIEYHSPGFGEHGVACSWAFATGLLMMHDQDGTHIPRCYFGHPRPGGCGVQYLRGSRVDEYRLLDLDSPSSLRQLRKELKAGSVYSLALVDQPRIMQACFMEPNQPRLEPRLSNRWISVKCSDTQVPFRVLAAAPVPRFTISISTNSKRCHLISLPDFKFRMTVTSLNRTPVKVSWSNLRGLWSLFGQAKCYDVDNGSTAYWPCLVDSGRTVELGNGSSGIGFNTGTPSNPREVFFPYGGTWTAERKLETIEPSPPVHTCRLSLQLDFTRLQLKDWSYANATEDVDADDRAKWPSKGYIVPEPVYQGWDAIESTLEAARPLPFFKLPPELRGIIYDLAKWLNDIEDVGFTFVVD